MFLRVYICITTICFVLLRPSDFSIPVHRKESPHIRGSPLTNISRHLPTLRAGPSLRLQRISMFGTGHRQAACAASCEESKDYKIICQKAVFFKV